MKHYKVGIVVDDSIDKSDGVQQYARTLGEWLIKNKHQVDYLVGESISNNSNVYSLSKNISVKFNGNNLSIPIYSDRKQIARHLNSQKYDILHIQMPYSPLLAGKIISIAPESTALVGTFHIMPYAGFQKFAAKQLGILQRHTLSKFRAIIAVSEPARKFAIRTFRINPVVIPNAIELSRFRTDIIRVPGRIVFLGRLVPRKGCEQLIRAYSILPKSLLDKTELVIAGDGPLRHKLQRLKDDLNLNNVKFLGSVSEQEKIELFASSTLAVFPSLSGESFGIVLLEAMAASSGLVIGGNNPGYKSVLDSWPDTLVDPTDIKGFSELIARHLTETDHASEISELQKIAVAEYDINKIGPKILEIYSQAIALTTNTKHNN